MAADYFDLDMDQGSTFQWDITVYDVGGVTPLDLTGYTVRSMIRKRYEDALPTETFNISYPDALNGKVRLLIPASKTAAIAKGRYVYDVELEDGLGKVVKIYKGFVVVYPEATK